MKHPHGNQIHGLHGTPIYKTWQGMLSRCFCKSNDSFQYYGGRGITVCEFLRCSPVNLTILIGARPAKMSLDRIDSNGNYSCGSCAECLSNGWTKNIRWATVLTQSRNRSNVRRITIDGVTKTIPEWCAESGVEYGAFWRRVKNGVSGEALLQTNRLRHWSSPVATLKLQQRKQLSL